MSLEYRIGDVFERLAEIPDGSIDLIVTSPPFLALRSYLPADHPDKGKEIGSEATPAAFIDTLLALTAEWGRVLAPHGSLCVELGDTFSGSGGAGGDYAAGGMRDGQEAFDGSAARTRVDGNGKVFRGGERQRDKAGAGWPLAKSLTGIPTIYPWSLAYGRNLLTGQPSPAGQWRIRNVIVWARPNPPVGALGDKFRPATSYITVACKSAKRYFDLDAVRTEYLHPEQNEHNGKRGGPTFGLKGPNTDRGDLGAGNFHSTTGGAPPLDWHTDHHPEDGDWLWKLSTQPYSGSHYAAFPMALPKRLIEAMCPLRVCTICGKPSERITEPTPEYAARANAGVDFMGANHDRSGMSSRTNLHLPTGDPGRTGASFNTIGWTDCGCAVTPADHNDRDAPGSSCRQGVSSRWRTGNVLDPFAGSGTTLEAAQAVGRHAIGIDLDHRNADLAQSRVGMFLEVAEPQNTHGERLFDTGNG
jgi:hypothetical protein